MPRSHKNMDSEVLGNVDEMNQLSSDDNEMDEISDNDENDINEVSDNDENDIDEVSDNEENEIDEISDNNDINQISDDEDDETLKNEEHDASGEESADEEEPKSQQNSGWADALSKVLRTNVSKNKQFILSKAKKDVVVLPKKEKPDIEMVDDSGVVIQAAEEPDKKKRPSAAGVKRKEITEKQQKKYLWENMCRIKPDVTNKERERMFVRIATKGVVHLFNAVEMHQKSHGSSNETSTTKRGKSLAAAKGTFMDMLKGNINPSIKVKSEPSKPVTKNESWSALKDNFMMGASLKDWDKESDDDDMK